MPRILISTTCFMVFVTIATALVAHKLKPPPPADHRNNPIVKTFQQTIKAVNEGWTITKHFILDRLEQQGKYEIFYLMDFYFKYYKLEEFDKMKFRLLFRLNRDFLNQVHSMHVISKLYKEVLQVPRDYLEEGYTNDNPNFWGDVFMESNKFLRDMPVMMKLNYRDSNAYFFKKVSMVIQS